MPEDRPETTETVNVQMPLGTTLGIRTFGGPDEIEATLAWVPERSAYRNLTPLMPHRGTSFTPQPSWSPDGLQIALLWKPRANDAWARVYLMNNRGRALRELTFRPDRVKTECSPQTQCVDLIRSISAITW